MLVYKHCNVKDYSNTYYHVYILHLFKYKFIAYVHLYENS
jgi:hypothetical protein